MGHFDPMVDIYCQNDEVSTVCTPMDPSVSGREVCADTPTVDASKLALVDRSSSA